MLLLSDISFGHSYPNRPITLAVTQAAAGTKDSVARTFAAACIIINFSIYLKNV
jgi:tripartite-type tricarboxylate transporter receptor subunit TctC